MHPQRHPLALGHQRFERHRHAVGRRVELGDLGGGLDPQGAQGEPLRRVGEHRRALVVAVQHQQQERCVARLLRKRGRRLEQGGRGVVGVVEHEQGRELALLGAADHLERGVGGARARGVDHHPLGLDRGGELGGEPGLADPRGPGDERDSGPTLLGLGPALSKPPQLAVSTGEQRRSALELARELGRRAGVEGGIVGEDLLLEAAQLGAGLDPDLLAQGAVCGAVALHGLGLAPGAVLREHALGVEALVRRVLRDQRFESADHLGVSSRRELGVDRELERAQVKFLEAADLRARERLGGDVGERGAAPQLQRALGRPVGDPLLGLCPRALDQALEARRVHRVVGELELVAPAAGDDLRPGVVGSQCLAQLRDVVLDVLGGGLRRAITPQPVDQHVGDDGAVGAQSQHRQHRSLLASPEWERAAVDERIDAAEEADLYSHVPLYQHDGTPDPSGDQPSRRLRSSVLAAHLPGKSYTVPAPTARRL